MNETPMASNEFAAAIDSGRKEHRALATLYAWLGLMEGLGVPAEHARPLVADDAVIIMPGGARVTGSDAIVAWVEQQQRRIRSSHHRIEDLDISSIAAGSEVRVDFGWKGIAADGQPMVARTRHRWELGSGTGPYAPIRSMHIEVVQPFTPVTANEPA